MIPVLRVTGMADQQQQQQPGGGGRPSSTKRVDSQQQLQRQDSGFLSGAPTPVTPSRPEMNANQPQQGGGQSGGHLVPRDSSLPPIPERSSPAGHQEMASILEKVKERIQEEDDEEEPTSIRPSRPTTLSPHAPPPKEEKNTPLTPGTVLRQYNENPGHLPNHLKEYIEKRADAIVQEVVPETPTSVQALPRPTHDVPRAELPHPTPPIVHQTSQDIVYPINEKYLHLGPDGNYYEIRDYDRVDNEILGEGGFGTVYACSDRYYQTMFAIKCNKHNSEEKVRNMNLECRVLDHIGHHTHITQLFGAMIDKNVSACVYEGQKFKMLMELATNGSLDELLFDPDTNEPSGLPFNQSLFYLQQILYAVHFLHQRAILHLDLKCANVLLFNEGRTVKLTDFGSAVRLDESGGCHIQSNKGLTPYFSAPEAIRCEYVSFSADIWSVLCCLVEMITGHLPWCYNGLRDPHNIIMLAGHYCDAEPLKYFRCLVPEGIETEDPRILELFEKVFKRNPKDRPTALKLLEHELIKDAHEYEKEFDQYEDIDGEVLAPPEAATPTSNDKVESNASGGSKKSSRASVDSGMDTERSSSNSSSPGSATELIDSKASFSIGTLPVPGGASDCPPPPHPPSSSSIGGLTSSSAPPNFNGGCWEDDIEKDGPNNRVLSRKLKRTTSANYVSNGSGL
ncbi:PREDICTED: serine/threonine-protein kinase SBK1-like isoform X2 [Amphimedon queenslandica]|uniref:Protein kinase domain-containing protein n=1 Tax=Amphimedon queenslandica TaxID=400682 RepID=A0AAN0JL03_AMPQE|nr:PREDICTED: serine/threonine-protein kinase SBK1-like isoform X2 [Amphimedon queenslandica]|eukprot:XP_019857702.1 PREDICTED: serine/threonine-protein kinase SBK1-like isoform X2 [Amphimedon queenslandica]